MKTCKTNWVKINEYCKNNNITTNEIISMFGCKKGALYSAIRKGWINKIYIKKQPAVTEEAKKKISDSMKRAHADGRHDGWGFINKDVNRRSYPEKFFFKVINNNEYFKKFTFKEKLPFGKYFLDFALIEKKIDIEIDGKQHFSTTEAIEHDKVRDKFLNDNGWIVYRIAWKHMSLDANKEITQLISFLEEDKVSNRIYTINEILYYKSQKNKCVCGNEKYKDSRFCNSCSGLNRRKFNPTKEELEILINQMPIIKIGEKFGVSDNAIRHRAKLFNLTTPPQGYWLKHNTPIV